MAMQSAFNLGERADLKGLASLWPILGWVGLFLESKVPAAPAAPAVDFAERYSPRTCFGTEGFLGRSWSQ